MAMKTKTEIADVLRAEANGNDLQDEGYRIVVCAERSDGSLYELGHVTTDFARQDPNGAVRMIGRIKWDSSYPAPRPKPKDNHD